MKRWWSSRSTRERVLLAATAGLAALFGFVQLLAVPAFERRQAARDAYSESLALAAEVRQGVRALSARETARAETDVASLRSALMQGARQRGLSIARVQPVDDGSLSLRFDAADPVVLYEWLAAAAEERGVRVRQASLTRNGASGAVQANVVIEEG